MAQLSLPYRVALLGLLCFSAVWFAVLRPGAAVPEPAPTLPGETAAAAPAPATAAPAARAGAAPRPAAKAAPKRRTAPARPAGAARRATVAGDRSAGPLAALDRGRAVVLLFTDGRGADDREVSRAVARVDRRGGDVQVRTAPLRDVGRYEAITRSMPVVSGPTVLVLGPDRRARAVTGLTTTGELDDAVSDALRARRPSRR